MSSAAPTKIRIQDLTEETKDVLYQAAHRGDSDAIVSILKDKGLPTDQETISNIISWYKGEQAFIEQQHAESKHEPLVEEKKQTERREPPEHRGEELHIDMLSDEMKETQEFRDKRAQVTTGEKWEKKRKQFEDDYKRSHKKNLDLNSDDYKNYMDYHLNKLAEHEFRNDKNNKDLVKRLDKETIEGATKSSIYEDHIGKQFVKRADEITDIRTKKLQKKLEKKNLSTEERAKIQNKIDRIRTRERENHIKAMIKDPRFAKKIAKYAEFDPIVKKQMEQIRLGKAKRIYKKSLKEAAKKNAETAQKLAVSSQNTVDNKFTSKANTTNTNRIKKTVPNSNPQNTFKQPPTPGAKMPVMGRKTNTQPNKRIPQRAPTQQAQKKKIWDAFSDMQPTSTPAPTTNQQTQQTQNINIPNINPQNIMQTGTKVVKIVSFLAETWWIWLLIIGVLLLVAIVVSIVENHNQQQQANNQNSNTQPIPGLTMNIAQTPANPVPNNTDITYTITLAYKGIDTIVVTDPINTGVAQFVSATGTYTNSADTITWNLSNNNPTFQGTIRNYTFSIKIHPISQDINYVNTVTANDVTLNATSSATSVITP